MEKLNLPQFNFKIGNTQGKLAIFDSIRKKYVVLTPEEWVRQNFVNYLIHNLNYPKSLLRLEGGLKYNALQKRADILVFDRHGAPFLLVECKSTRIKITQKAVDQAATYNHSVKANYLAVTNGLEHYCYHIDHQSGKTTFLKDFPAYDG